MREESAREKSEGRDRLRALNAELALAEERERRRIAVGLHDRVSQLLGIAKIKLGEALAADPADEIAKPLSEGRRFVDRAIREVRALTFELSSPVLHELGLEPALADLAERAERRHGVPCRFKRSAPSAAVPAELGPLLYSIVRELLWNAVKHARPRHLKLALGSRRDRLRIVVEDDGVGFEPDEDLAGPGERSGLGLLGARERLEQVGGSLAIDSTPGRGTRIVLTVPLGP